MHAHGIVSLYPSDTICDASGISSHPNVMSSHARKCIFSRI